MSIRNKAKTAAIIVTVLLMTSAMFMATQVQPVEAAAALTAEQPRAGALPSGVTVEATMTPQAYLSFRPNPVGVGQTLLVNFWITPSLASDQRLLPQAYIITITKPDGTTNVRTMDSEPATAANWFEYVPDVAGNYTIKMEFLGTYFPAGYYYDGLVYNESFSGAQLYGSAYYKPASTEAQPLTVQDDFVWSWPPAPLPTDYWSRPASLNNREWWPILGAYPATGYNGEYGYSKFVELYPDTNLYDSYGRYNFVPWVQAPNTPHVLWKRTDNIAGIIGGPAGQYGLASSPNTPNLIYAGRCYDTRTIYLESRAAWVSCAVCTDLRTGQLYYAVPTSEGGVTPSYIAYLPAQATGTTHAAQQLGDASFQVELLTISGGRLYKINPNTGAVTGNYSISPLTTGYYTNQIDGYMHSVQDLGSSLPVAERYRLINWTTRGSSSTLASRIQSNISWPVPNLPNQYTGGTGVGQVGTGIALTDFNAGIMAFVTRQTQPGSSILWGVNITGYSLSTGQPLGWKVELPDEGTYSASAMVADHGLVAILTQKGVFLAYDLQTGHLAWESERMEYPWGAPGFGAYAIQSAYGMLFRESYDGVYAFNWTNGKIVWKYVAPAYASFETPYITDGQEHYSFNTGATIADGKMYTYNTEHTQTYPITRGWGIHCINITTGERVWTLNNPMSTSAIADGYLVASNSWDGTMYVIGKGKTATTVTAPDVSVPLGTAFTIKGSVMDMSPAQPNTPCVSADSMQTQMEYLHLQMPIGGLWNNLSITGVPVTLTAIGSDGSVTDLGSVTTNGYYGTFEMAWTPTAEGTYQIVANFASDDSYGSSAAATAVTVGPAPEQIVIPEPEAPVDNSMLLYGILVAVIIAIVLALIALVVIFQKK